MVIGCHWTISQTNLCLCTLSICLLILRRMVSGLMRCNSQNSVLWKCGSYNFACTHCTLRWCKQDFTSCLETFVTQSSFVMQSMWHPRKIQILVLLLCLSILTILIPCIVTKFLIYKTKICTSSVHNNTGFCLLLLFKKHRLYIKKERSWHYTFT